MKILKLVPLCAVLATSSLTAQDTAPAPAPASEVKGDATAEPKTSTPNAEPVNRGTAGSAVTDSTAPTETPASVTEADPAAAAAEQPSRPLPKVRQGTPYTVGRGKMITFAILFFLLSVFMALILLRTKEDIPTA